MKLYSQQVQLIILLIFTSARLSNAQNTEGALLFGKSRINITPDISVDLHGYGQQRISSGVDDSLYCRVAYFQLNDKELVLVSTDVCVIPDEVYNAVKDSLTAKFGFAQDEIFIAATHTHSGPEITFRENYPYQNNLLYTVGLLNKIILAVENARGNAWEANLFFGKETCDVAVNRRLPVETSPAWPGDGGFMAMASNPEGLVDHNVQVINVFDKDNHIKASLFNYGCHNRARPPQSTKISNDFFGVASTHLEDYFRQNLLSDAIALSFAGASGDIDPLHAPGSFGYTDGIVPDPEEMGEDLKTTVMPTLFSKEEIHVNKIQTTFIDLQLPAKNYFTYTVNPNLPKRNLNITIASLGELCLIGIGAEVCVEIGMILQNLSPFKNTVIITHCNGASGYLPSANMYPERGYEVSGSLFAPGASDQAIVKTIEALDSMYQVSTTSGSVIYQDSALAFQANIISSENTPGRYTIEFKNIKHGKVHCQLHTLDGKMVFNEIFSQCGKTFTTHIDLGNLHGMYLLTSVSGKNIQTRKIIIN